MSNLLIPGFKLVDGQRERERSNLLTAMWKLLHRMRDGRDEGDRNSQGLGT